MQISKNLQMHAVQCKYSNTALIDLISDKQKKSAKQGFGRLGTDRFSNFQFVSKGIQKCSSHTMELFWKFP